MSVNGLPRFVHRKVAKGLVYYYFASGGVRVRLPDISDPAFDPCVAELSKLRTPKNHLREAGARFVYFIGAEDGPIKIGVSDDPERRCADFRCGSPYNLQVLATVEGNERLEREYHQRFAPWRMRGEWFRRHPEIEAEIDRLNAEERLGNVQTCENMGSEC